MVPRGSALAVALAAVLIPIPPPAASAQPTAETLVEIRVQGNFTVPDDDVIALAGLSLGMSVGPAVIADVVGRLEATGRFDSVDVRKRYRSLSVNDRVTLVLVVRERAAAAGSNPFTRSLGGLGRQTMFLPIMSYDEGYGFSYGARTSFVEALGSDGRISVPVTWGGTRRVGLEFDRRFGGRVVDGIRGGVARRRREHPHFGVDDDRVRLWVEADRRLPARLRLSGHGAWEDVRFADLSDRVARYGIELEVDTREDVAFPRNAAFAAAGVEWIAIGGASTTIAKPRVDARAYVGGVGQAVLAVRAVYEGSTAPLPVYEKLLLGGGGTLRGWRVGELIGDRMAAGTIELRLPWSSPLSFGKAGFKVFVDVAAAYDVGQSIRKTRFRKGAGGGIFFSVPFVQLQIDVAHNLVDGVRAHVAAGATF